MNDISNSPTPFYEAEGWKPMTEEQIARALDELSSLPDAGMMYLPEFYCKRKGLPFEDANRSLSLKEAIDCSRKPKTARERLQAKLEERKKSHDTAKQDAS